MKNAPKPRVYTLVFLLLFCSITISACLTPAGAGVPQAPSQTQPRQTPIPIGIASTSTPPPLKEYPVQILAMADPINNAQAELSGLAWINDTLLLLPQYPERFQQPANPGSFGALFAITKEEILSVIDGKSTAPLQPKAVPLFAPNLKKAVNGYEGFESVVVSNQKIFFTIETHQLDGMAAYILSGSIATDLSEIRLDTDHSQISQAQAPIPNFSDEAMTLVNQTLVTFYEGNGAKIIPTPVAHLFGQDGSALGTLSVPNLEYRITDASPADANGRFWVINYFFPGDTKINPSSDPIFERYGKPLSHSRSKAVERLVQMQWSEKRIDLVDQPPVYLQLLPDDTARNWEGLALLDGRGFLLVTDSYPSTLLGFVAFP